MRWLRGLPVRLLAVGILVSLMALVSPPSSGKTGGEDKMVEVDITARQWAYDPGIIEVNQGDRVRLKVMATDVMHGLSLDGYDEVNAKLKVGQPVMIEFVADRPGRWMFRCSETCGSFHPYMIGWLRVKPNWYAGASWFGAALIGFGFTAFLLYQRVKS